MTNLKVSKFKSMFGLKQQNVDLRKFIVTTELENSDEHQQMGNKGFDTKDRVYLSLYHDINSIYSEDRKVSPTDYAIANGVIVKDQSNNENEKKTAPYWLRSASYSNMVDIVDENGFCFHNYVGSSKIGIIPIMRLNVKALTDSYNQKRLLGMGKVAAVKDVNGKEIYHTIEFGFYPKSEIKNPEYLEKLLCYGEIIATGKKYTGSILKVGKYTENLEYEYQGEYFVRVSSSSWFKIEPITWRILNWNLLSEQINPKGLGLAEYMEIRAENVITSGIPFQPGNYNSFWQNSSIRGFLNGINVSNIKTNGNPKYSINFGDDFSRTGGFLKEAFVFPSELLKTKDIIKNKPTEEKYTQYDDDSLDVTEMGM